MKLSLQVAALRGGARRREAVLVLVIVAAALVSAFSFRAAVHPEDLHRRRHHARFADDCRVLPALGAMRVRWPPGLAYEEPRAIQQLRAFGLVTGLTPDAVGRFRRARYLFASPAEVAAANAALREDRPPVPPPAPDLTHVYEDGNGPYLCDLDLASGVAPSDVRAALPDARLSGEPLAREAEDREALSIARELLLGLAVLAAWLVWRLGMREAELRLLAALGVLVVAGLLGARIDRWSVAALLLVAGAPAGAPLLLASPCLLLPVPVLQRLGLVLCLGGALRLLFRRPVVPALPGLRAMAAPAALAVVLAVAAYLAMDALPVRADEQPEVAAERGALFVPRRDVAETARRLRAKGLDVTGDEPLLPPPPDPARRRSLWRIFTRARTLAARAEGPMRARFEDVADAASQISLTTLPRELRARLLTTDSRAVLWAPADAEHAELDSARLYRERGERELRVAARLAGVLVIVVGCLAVAVFGGGTRKMLLRFAGAAAGAALVLLVAPGDAGAHLPVIALAAAAPAIGPAIALGAAGLVHPGLLWPAAALLLASAISPRSPRSPTRPSS